MQVELRQRTLGELFGLTFSLTAAHFGKLFAIAALLELPSLAVEVLRGYRRSLRSFGGSSSTALLLFAAAMLLTILLRPLQQGASLLLISGSFTGQKPSLADSLRVGLRKLLPLLGYSFITGIITFCGLACFLVPGLIFLTWYFVGPAALVVEDLGVNRAALRSKALSAGFRRQLLAFVLLIYGTFIGAAILAGMLIGKFFFRTLAGTVLAWLAEVVLTLPTTVAPVVYYFQLRVAKEALDVHSLSSLVDAIEARARTTAAAPAE